MNFSETKAIYLQIADHVCDDIITGKIAIGERILSIRDLAVKLEVNANTVLRTYEYLQNKGIIFNKRGLGYFVTDDASSIIAASRREQLLDEDAVAFFKRMASVGITPNELAQVYSQFCNNQTTKNG